MSDSTTPLHQELIAGYALQILNPEEVSVAETLLAENPELQADLTAYQSIMGLIAETTPPIVTPPDLRSRIMAATQIQAIVPSPSARTVNPLLSRTASPQPRPRRRRWSDLAAGIAAILTLALGLNNYHLSQQLTQVQARLDQALLDQKHFKEGHEDYAFLLKSQIANPTTQGLVVVNLGKKKIDLALSGLPPINEDEAYHLWAFTKDQKKILCGRFRPSEQGVIQESIVVQAEDYQSEILFMRVSKEPAVTPPDPSRRSLILSSET